MTLGGRPRLTSWVKAIAGALGAVLGVVLAVRPFASVSLLLLALGDYLLDEVVVALIGIQRHGVLILFLS